MTHSLLNKSGPLWSAIVLATALSFVGFPIMILAYGGGNDRHAAGQGRSIAVERLTIVPEDSNDACNQRRSSFFGQSRCVLVIRARGGINV